MVITQDSFELSWIDKVTTGTYRYRFPSSLVWPVIFVLKLNDSVALAPSKLTIAPLSFTAGISLQYYHRLPDVFE